MAEQLERIESAPQGFFGPPRAGGLRGITTVPGDKSISHRAVMLGAVSEITVAVDGFLRSADTLATVRAVRALGVGVDETGPESLVVNGAGWEGLREPEDVIDVANAGTLIRLLPGLLASLPFLCVLTGDSSIRRRPMARILEPLAAMGASVWGRDGNRLPPIAVRGGNLRGARHELRVASAQVKSCILLAGLRADGPTEVMEPAPSRDHTERMIRHGGGRVEREGDPLGPGIIRAYPGASLSLPRVDVPGDLSSAAFLLVAALLLPESDLRVERVGLNPTRAGILEVLKRMGADLEIVPDPEAGGAEPIGAVRVRSGRLEACEIRSEEVPLLIDELPIWALAAARANGVSRLRGAAELRVKESDRLAAVADVLRTLGVEVREYEDGLDITGRPETWSGGRVQARGDHRLAMVGAVAGLASRDGVFVDDTECIEVSFPSFIPLVRELTGA